MHLGNVTEKHPDKNGPPNWEDMLGGHCILEGIVFARYNPFWGNGISYVLHGL